ncbi:MAG: Flagellar hook capping protein - N-terminal region [Chlamydiales bacterium]|jgi:flagellar basal-body rod modification protein FlgD|nr:Flagellar hook capping protein - N-terminal region [Chlamydiales bacterium]
MVKATQAAINKLVGKNPQSIQDKISKDKSIKSAKNKELGLKFAKQLDKAASGKEQEAISERERFNKIVERSQRGMEEKKKRGDKLDKDDILKLLMAQMKNQDLEGTSTEAMMNQMSAMASVEQLTNLSSSMEKIDNRLATMEATSLQNRLVSFAGDDFYSDDPTFYTQEVMGITRGKEGPVLQLDSGKQIKLDDIKDIYGDPIRQQTSIKQELLKYAKDMVRNERPNPEVEGDFILTLNDGTQKGADVNASVFNQYLEEVSRQVANLTTLQPSQQVVVTKKDGSKQLVEQFILEALS